MHISHEYESQRVDGAREADEKNYSWNISSEALRCESNEEENSKSNGSKAYACPVEN